MNLSVFKSYDTRGIYPEDLNEDLAFAIGQALVVHIKAKNVAVGRDMRLGSPELMQSLIKGIISQGANVYNIGLIPTEGIYFAVGKYGYDAGVMITASHNPKEYNGIKIVRNENGIPRMVRGRDIKELVKNNFPEEGRGEIKELDIWTDYINHIFSVVDAKEIKPLKVVVDAGNGMASKVINLIKDKLPIEIIPLNFDLDGSFPAHPSNALLKGVTKQISEEVKKQKADVGFIFDGDADRIYIIDENGDQISGDMTLLLLAKYLLKKNPEQVVSYNLICSKSVPEFVKKWGGKPVKTPVGFVNVSEALLKHKGVFGGELSGHYSFRDYYYSDSGFVTFLILLQLISNSDKKVSEIIKEFSMYAKSPELNFEVEDKEGIIAKFKEKYSDGEQEEMDGLSVSYKDWWFNIRPSNTEPLLRLTIEADNEKLLKVKIKELKSLII